MIICQKKSKFSFKNIKNKKNFNNLNNIKIKQEIIITYPNNFRSLEKIVMKCKLKRIRISKHNEGRKPLNVISPR